MQTRAGTAAAVMHVLGLALWAELDLSGVIKECRVGLTSSPWIFTSKAHPVLILEFPCPCWDLWGVKGPILVL